MLVFLIIALALSLIIEPLMNIFLFLLLIFVPIFAFMCDPISASIIGIATYFALKKRK